MDEHAKAQINEGLLQFMQRLLLGSSHKGGQQAREKKDFSHQVLPDILGLFGAVVNLLGTILEVVQIEFRP